MRLFFFQDYIGREKEKKVLPFIFYGKLNFYKFFKGKEKLSLNYTFEEMGILNIIAR